MIKKIISIAFFACILVLNSCNKSDSLLQEPQVSTLETTSMNGPSKVSSSSWGFPLLSSTGNGAKYFNVGTYAVQLKRSLLDPSTVTFTLTVDNQSNSSVAYAAAYKNDANNNQLYYSGWQPFSHGNGTMPIPNISITGSQSAVYVFKVVVAGYYVFWYRTI